MADQETRSLVRLPRCHHLLLLGAVIGFRLLGLWRQHRRVERLDVTAAEARRMYSREAILIINSNARRVAADLNRARAELARSGITIVEEIPIEDTDRLQKHLSKSPPYLVIAAGGDGTVSSVADKLANSVADKLANSRTTMAILPLGTCNDFARSLGIPVDVIEAIRLFTEGKESTVDLGQLVSQGRPRHFVHAATVGVNAGFAKLATSGPLRHRLGRLTYLVSGGATALWGRRPFQCRLTFDGQLEELELLQLTIFNAPVFGGFLGLRVQGSNIGDRILDVLAVENIPLRKLVLVGVLYILRYQRRIAGIRIFHAGHIHIQACQPLEVTLDGEITDNLPAEFKGCCQGIAGDHPSRFRRYR